MPYRKLTVLEKLDIPLGLLQAGKSLLIANRIARLIIPSDRNSFHLALVAVSRAEYAEDIETPFAPHDNPQSADTSVARTVAVRSKSCGQYSQC